MNTIPNHEFAKIYQFPIGGRATFGSRRPDETKATNADSSAARVSEVACGDCWYHEAAIEESMRDR